MVNKNHCYVVNYLYTIAMSSVDDILRDEVRRSNFFKVRELIRMGADVNSVDEHGRTALHLAAFVGAVDIALFLIQQGASVNAKATNGETPLHAAAYAGASELIGYLIKAGGDTGAMLVTKETALDVAVRCSRIEAEEILRQDADAAHCERNAVRHAARKSPSDPAGGHGKRRA